MKTTLGQHHVSAVFATAGCSRCLMRIKRNEYSSDHNEMCFMATTLAIASFTAQLNPVNTHNTKASNGNATAGSLSL